MAPHFWLLILGALLSYRAVMAQTQGIICYSCAVQLIGTSLSYKSITYNPSSGGSVTEQVVTTTTSTTTAGMTVPGGVSGSNASTTTTQPIPVAATTAGFSGNVMSISIGSSTTICSAAMCYTGADACMTAKVVLQGGFTTFLYGCVVSASCNDAYSASVFQSLYSNVNSDNVVTQCCGTNGCNAVTLGPATSPNSASGLTSYNSAAIATILVSVSAFLKRR